eukprot:TRINITY_DN65420_c0_g1_i1.p1 TRINITY_DN65420_c0_g1~~TRINITY_DN65420_c0_g1_i1.p1  ORF type:complete len:112 (-),score=8.41 TRINITY_DN65420_c0_g1_i1:278-613(-)
MFDELTALTGGGLTGALARKTPDKVERSCTNVGIVAVFGVCIFVMFIISCSAYIGGSVEAAFHLRDSAGIRCGFDEGAKDKPLFKRCLGPDSTWWNSKVVSVSQNVLKDLE